MTIDFDIEQWIADNTELLTKVMMENINNQSSQTAASKALSLLISEIKSASSD